MDSDAYARRWELVASHRDRLLPVALARCTSRADAEDAVHEAMVRAVTYADLDEARLRAFLTTVTVRLCIDQHRRRERDLRAGTAVFHGAVDDLGPEPDACDRAEAAWVADVLATLPERQREVVEARAAGADLAETARRLHLSYRAVESALARARTQVRAAMAAGAAVLAAFARRARYAAAPAGAMTAVSLTAAVVVLGAPPVRPEARPVTTPPRGTAYAPPPAAQAAPAATLGGTRRSSPAAAPLAARPAARPVRAAGPPQGERVVYVPGPDGNDVAVTAHDTDETTAELVERCATGGYTIDIETRQGRCTKQEDDPGAYPLSDALRDALPPTEGLP